jgi:hypothetical protein
MCKLQLIEGGQYLVEGEIGVPFFRSVNDPLNTVN